MLTVNAELKHGKTIFQQLFSEQGIDLSFLFCFSWEIKEYHYPHNPIFTQSFQGLLI